MRTAEAKRFLAHTRIDDVGAVARDREYADAGTAKVNVGDALGPLPHPARAGAEVEHHGVVGVTSYRNNATASTWTDAAPFEGLEAVGVSHTDLGRHPTTCQFRYCCTANSG